MLEFHLAIESKYYSLAIEVSSVWKIISVRGGQQSRHIVRSRCVVAAGIYLHFTARMSASES